MKKLVQFFRKNRFAVMLGSMLSMIVGMAVAVGAEGATAPSPTTDYQSVISIMQGIFQSTTITTVLVYAAGIAIAMVFTWWAVRKVTGIVKRAFMRGRLRL